MKIVDAHTHLLDEPGYLDNIPREEGFHMVKVHVPRAAGRWRRTDQLPIPTT
jgi:hypothetical protein